MSTGQTVRLKVLSRDLPAVSPIGPTWSPGTIAAIEDWLVGQRYLNAP